VVGIGLDQPRVVAIGRDVRGRVGRRVEQGADPVADLLEGRGLQRVAVALGLGLSRGCIGRQQRLERGVGLDQRLDFLDRYGPRLRRVNC
jgi:hypothetical protein